MNPYLTLSSVTFELDIYEFLSSKFFLLPFSVRLTEALTPNVEFCTPKATPSPQIRVE